MFINWTWVSGRRLAVPVILAEIWMASAESVMKMQWHRFAEWVRLDEADPRQARAHGWRYNRGAGSRLARRSPAYLGFRESKSE